MKQNEANLRIIKKSLIYSKGKIIKIIFYEINYIKNKLKIIVKYACSEFNQNLIIFLIPI